MGTFVGVDLAWGTRARSGLATMDDEGRLVSVRSALTDEEIIDYIRPHLDAACLVAFDAPLVVNNVSGARPCEKIVNAHFRRFHAGCYPANRGMAAFADGGRASRIARALRLDTRPTSTAEHRAIEVYPHPAIVMLFDLDRILRYKNRGGRGLELLRAELATLMTHMDRHLGPAADSPPWLELRSELERAQSKRRLKAVEDRVDAVVCAAVARYTRTTPALVRVFGDGEEGYIVTPVTPTLAATLPVP